MSGAATMDSPPELLNERKLMGMARDALHGVIDNNTIQQFQLLASKVLRDHGTLLAAVPQFQSSIELFERMDRRLKIVEEGLAKVPHGMKNVETFSRPVSVQRSVLGGNQADDIEDALVEHDKRLAELTGVIQGQAQRIGELEAALAEQGRQAAVLHEEVTMRVAEVDEAVQLIDVDIITEREANLIVLHEIATREASARAELGEWVRREFVPNGALAAEKSVREREWARAASDSAALRQEVEASRLQLIQRINDNATDIDNVKATIHSTENVLPTREEWDALGEALEDAKEWRDEAVDKITALRSDLTSMEEQHEALREQQRGEVAALLEKQVASAAHEEQQRTVLVERLDAIHEDAEVIELVKNEIYEVTPTISSAP